MRHESVARGLYQVSGLRRLRIAVAGSDWSRRRQDAAWDRAAAALAQTPWVVLPTGVRLYVDPADRRAHALRATGGGLDPGLTRWWSVLVEALQPALVIDVGANYGEVLFSSRYDAAATVLAVEANPGIAAALERTAGEDGRGVIVHQVGASDADGEAVLTVDPSWSGTSALAPTSGDGGVLVPVRRLDDLVEPAASSILMKVDVEGHELAVLRGARRLLGEARHAAAVVEFIHLGPDDVEQLHRDYRVFLLRRRCDGLDESEPATLRRLIDSGSTERWLRDVLVTPGDQLLPLLAARGIPVH